MWSGFPLLSLLCSAVAASSNLAFAVQDSSGFGFRDDDFIIGGVRPSNHAATQHHTTIHSQRLVVPSAVSILREVVSGPPTVWAVGSIVLIHHIARKFMTTTIPNSKKNDTTPTEVTTTPTSLNIPQEANETLPAPVQVEDHYPNNNTESSIISKKDESLLPDYESLYKNLSEHLAQEQRRWALLQADLSEQKDYWEARVNTQEYQHELAVQQLRDTMLTLLEEEKKKLQKSFQDQAEELRMRLGGGGGAASDIDEQPTEKPFNLDFGG